LLVSALLYRHWLADKERQPAGKNSVTYDHASLSKQIEKIKLKINWLTQVRPKNGR